MSNQFLWHPLRLIFFSPKLVHFRKITFDQTKIKCWSAVATLRAEQGLCKQISVGLSLTLSQSERARKYICGHLWLSVKHVFCFNVAFLLQLCKTVPFCREMLKYGTFCCLKMDSTLRAKKWQTLRSKPTPDSNQPCHAPLHLL